MRSKETMIYPEGSPEKCAADFLTAWQNKDFQEMIRFTQITWIKNQPKGLPLDKSQVKSMGNMFPEYFRLDVNKITGESIKSPEQTLVNYFNSLILSKWDIIDTLSTDEEYRKWKIGDIVIETNNDVMVDVVARIEVEYSPDLAQHYLTLPTITRYAKNLGAVQKKTILMRLIKEKNAYEASRDGIWGVNPISLFRKN